VKNLVMPEPGGRPGEPSPTGFRGRIGVGVITGGSGPPPMGGCGKTPVVGGGTVGSGWMPPSTSPGGRAVLGWVDGLVPGLVECVAAECWVVLEVACEEPLPGSNGVTGGITGAV
jgi:hypothetical protein